MGECISYSKTMNFKDTELAQWMQNEINILIHDCFAVEKQRLYNNYNVNRL